MSLRNVKLLEKKLYLLPSGQIVRVIKTNKAVEKVFVFNYETQANEALDLDFAKKYFTPMMTIGEVAKIVGRTPHTLRTYERQGLIDKARQFQTGSGSVKKVRLYSPDEVYEIVDFFIRRRGAGRPAMHNIANIDIDRVHNLMNAKYER
jgi:hypothetical protein